MGWQNFNKRNDYFGMHASIQTIPSITLSNKREIDAIGFWHIMLAFWDTMCSHLTAFYIKLFYLFIVVKAFATQKGRKKNTLPHNLLFSSLLTWVDLGLIGFGILRILLISCSF